MSRKASIRKSAPTLRQIIVRFWPQIRRQRFLIAGSLLATLAEIAFRLLEPWPLKFVFDRVIPTAPTGGESGVALVDRLDAMTLLLLCAVALVLITSLRSYSSYLGTVGFALAGNRVLTAARAELFSHLQRLSLSFHHKSKTGDLLTRVIGDVGRLQEVAVTAALPLAVNVLSLVGMLALMTWMNWRLSVAALLILPLFLIASRTLGRRIRQAARRQREREGQMGSTAAEARSRSCRPSRWRRFTTAPSPARTSGASRKGSRPGGCRRDSSARLTCSSPSEPRSFCGTGPGWSWWAS
jgi:ATP-binding cassette subfamily B protein